MEALPRMEGSRHASGGSSGTTVLPPRGCYHLVFCAVKLREEGEQLCLPFTSRLKKKHPLSLEIQFGKSDISYSLLSASSRVNRKTRAEHKTIKPWYVPLSEDLFGLLFGLRPRGRYPWWSHSSTTTGTTRDANAASSAPTWHISHQFLHGSSEPWAFPIALEWANLKVCHPGHSAPIPTITITDEQTSSLVYPWWITATWQPPAQKDPTRSAHQGIYKSASLTAVISSNSPRKGSLKMHCTHFRCCTWITDSPALPFKGGRRKELPWFCEGRGTIIPNRAYQGMHVVHPISPWNKKSVAVLSSSLLQTCLWAVTVLDVS